MSIFVRAVRVAAALVLVPAACTSSTAPPVQDALAGTWALSQRGCVQNNPAPCAMIRFTLTQQGSALNGAGYYAWIGFDSLAASGAADGKKVHLTLAYTQGYYAGQTIQFDGELLFGSTLLGKLTFFDDPNAPWKAEFGRVQE